VAQHLAAKLHAYTLPREQPNTRLKDLVDMVAMAAIDQVEADVLMRSVEATFEARGTHAVRRATDGIQARAGGSERCSRASQVPVLLAYMLLVGSRRVLSRHPN